MRMILRSLEGGFPNLIPRMLRGMDSSPIQPDLVSNADHLDRDDA
jgi:hypothetical protein